MAPDRPCPMPAAILRAPIGRSDGSLTLDGSGQAITVDGANLYTVLVNGSATLDLNDLTIAVGNTTGGGVFNEGTLSVTNSTFSGNFAIDGGGIYNTNGGTV